MERDEWTSGVATTTIVFIFNILEIMFFRRYFSTSSCVAIVLVQNVDAI